jgi:hypothetical protein
MYYCIIADVLQHGLKHKYYSTTNKRNHLTQLCDYVFCDDPYPRFIVHPADKVEFDKEDHNLYTMVVLGSVPWKGISEEVV